MYNTWTISTLTTIPMRKTGDGSFQYDSQHLGDFPSVTYGSIRPVVKHSNIEELQRKRVDQLRKARLSIQMLRECARKYNMKKSIKVSTEKDNNQMSLTGKEVTGGEVRAQTHKRCQNVWIR